MTSSITGKGQLVWVQRWVALAHDSRKPNNCGLFLLISAEPLPLGVENEQQRGTPNEVSAQSNSDYADEGTPASIHQPAP